MSTMTTEQQLYLTQRLSEITRDKVKAKEVELFGEAGAQAVTWGQVFAAIKAGEIVLKEGTEDLTRPYLMPTDVEWPALAAKKQELEDYKESLAKERKKAMDAIILGDAVSVLKAYEAV